MAWLSVGNSNEDLCKKLMQYSILSPGSIFRAFQFTDRGDFVPSEDRIQAYYDRPYKKGEIHISAPHMYVSVLEALEISEGHSFLNVGSGSGYLNCLAAFLVGRSGISHGIEISERMVSYSKGRADAWLESIHRYPDLSDQEANLPTQACLQFFHGNCFDINVKSVADCGKYDRIYVGAGCPEKQKEFFYSMLAENGVLVIPIDETNELLKIKRMSDHLFCVHHVSNVHFAPLRSAPVTPIVSRSASRIGSADLLRRQAGSGEPGLNAKLDTILDLDPEEIQVFYPPEDLNGGPGAIRLPQSSWRPDQEDHSRFPKEFKTAAKTLMLCLCRLHKQYYNRLQSAEPQAMENPSPSPSPSPICFLPTQIWLHVLSFANRDWFQTPKSLSEILACELLAERQLRIHAEAKLRELEKAKKKIERERNMYYFIMLRNGLAPSGLDRMVEESDMESEDEDAATAEDMEAAGSDEDDIDDEDVDEEVDDGEEEERRLEVQAAHPVQSIETSDLNLARNFISSQEMGPNHHQRLPSIMEEANPTLEDSIEADSDEEEHSTTSQNGKLQSRTETLVGRDVALQPKEMRSHSTNEGQDEENGGFHVEATTCSGPMEDQETDQDAMELDASFQYDSQRGPKERSLSGLLDVVDLSAIHLRPSLESVTLLDEEEGTGDEADEEGELEVMFASHKRPPNHTEACNGKTNSIKIPSCPPEVHDETLHEASFSFNSETTVESHCRSFQSESDFLASLSPEGAFFRSTRKRSHDASENESQVVAHIESDL